MSVVALELIASAHPTQSKIMRSKVALAPQSFKKNVRQKLDNDDICILKSSDSN
jgi:hypothetical protein